MTEDCGYIWNGVDFTPDGTVHAVDILVVHERDIDRITSKIGVCDEGMFDSFTYLYPVNKHYRHMLYILLFRWTDIQMIVDNDMLRDFFGFVDIVRLKAPHTVFYESYSEYSVASKYWLN